MGERGTFDGENWHYDCERCCDTGCVINPFWTADDEAERLVPCPNCREAGGEDTCPW